nr:MAG TPA: FIP FIP domain [Caudoviricetes sp.]
MEYLFQVYIDRFWLIIMKNHPSHPPNFKPS